MRPLVELHTGSSAEARGVVRAELAGRCSAEKIEDVMLAVSELLNNAVIHGGGEPRVSAFGAASRLRVEVWDADPHPPVMAPLAAPDADHGRGLHLVDGVTSKWGCEVRGAGKVVWFEIDLSDDPSVEAD